MAATHQLIKTVTVGPTSVASIEFTSIPQTYTDLKIVFSLRNSGTDLYISLNGSTTGFDQRYMQGDGSGTISASSLARLVGFTAYTSHEASNFGNGELYLPNYTGSTNKCFYSDNVTESNSSTAWNVFSVHSFTSSSAINQITFTGNGTGFVQYSSASLYGIKNS